MLKFRPHSLHLIMEGKKLSETAKKSICQLYDSVQRGVKYEISSKYLDKGLQVEDQSIEEVKKIKFGYDPKWSLKQFREYKAIEYKKNTITFKNDWLIGTPDIIYTDSIGTREYIVVDDVKNSYTRATWLYSVSQIIENRTVIDAYYWQLQAYMMLIGAEDSNLIYCLMNTPFEIVESEKRKSFYKLGNESEFENIEKMHNFDNLPLNQRFFITNVQRNNSDIEKIKDKVEQANDWIEKYIKFNFKEKNEHLNENSAFEV